MDKSLTLVCLLCWEPKYTSQLRSATEAVKEVIKVNFCPGLDELSVPSKICSRCYKEVYNIKAGRMVQESWRVKIEQVNNFDIDRLIKV